MVPQELTDYIESERAKGTSDLIIRQNLIQGGGWTDADLNITMQPRPVLKTDWSDTTTPQTYTPYSPQQGIASSQSYVPGHIDSASANIGASYAPQSTSPAPHMATHTRYGTPDLPPAPQHSAKKSAGLILALIILLAAGLGAYAFWDKITNFGGSNAPYSEGGLFQGLLDRSALMNSFRYNVTMNLATNSRDYGIEPLPISETSGSPTLVNWAQYMKTAPAEVNFTGSVSGTFAKSVNGVPSNGEFGLKIFGDFDDFSMELDAELRKVGPDYFVIARKFPTFFLLSMFTPLKGQWIKFTPQIAPADSKPSSVSSSDGIIQSFEKSIKRQDENMDKGKTEMRENLRKFVEIADRTKLLEFSEAPRLEDLGDEKLWKYSLVLKKENLLAFAKEFTAAFPEEKSDYYSYYENDADDLVDYLEDPNSKPMMDYFSKNLFFDFWVGDDGMPRKLSVRLRVVPPYEAVHLAEKQVDYTASINITDINKTINVSAPDKYLTAKEADELLESLNPSILSLKEKEKDAKIISDVQQLRTQIESDYNGVSYKNSFVSPTKLVDSGAYKALTDDIQKQGGSFNVVSTATYNSYALYGRLVSKPTEYFCVDSTGRTAMGIKVNTGKTCP